MIFPRILIESNVVWKHSMFQCVNVRRKMIHDTKCVCFSRITKSKLNGSMKNSTAFVPFEESLSRSVDRTICDEIAWNKRFGAQQLIYCNRRYVYHERWKQDSHVPTLTPTQTPIRTQFIRLTTKIRNYEKCWNCWNVSHHFHIVFHRCRLNRIVFSLRSLYSV